MLLPSLKLSQQALKHHLLDKVVCPKIHMQCNVLVKQYDILNVTSQACAIRALIDDLQTTIRKCDIIDDREAIIRQINDHFQDFKSHFKKLGIETTGLFREHNVMTSLLHSAVAAGSKEMVEELVEFGAGQCNFYSKINTYSLWWFE